MKPIDKLRTAARNMAKGSNLANHEECNLLLVIADEIEAEIANRFIELPTDADGVPWTLETESFVDDTGRKVKFSGLQVDRKRRWEIINVCVCHDPSLCRHVKQRTLEDVLMDAGVSRAAINDVADEIRELLGGDA